MANVSITVFGQDCSNELATPEDFELVALLFTRGAQYIRDNKHGTINAKDDTENEVGAIDIDQGEEHEFDEGTEETPGKGIPTILTLTKADVEAEKQVTVLKGENEELPGEDQEGDVDMEDDVEDDTEGGDDYPASQRRAPAKRTPAAHASTASNLRKQVNKNTPRQAAKKAPKKAAKKSSRR